MAHAAEVQFFQHLLPVGNQSGLTPGPPVAAMEANKRAKTEQQQRGRKHKGNFASKSNQNMDKDMQQLLNATAKLTLQLADAHQTILLDCGFTWFVSTEPGGVLPVMFGVSSEGRKIQEQNPQQLKHPLHVIMMECIMAELRARLTKTSQEEAMKQAALQTGWVDQQGLWLYKSWDPVKKALTTMAKDPLSIALDKIIAEIQADLQVPGALHRFHASQPLKADMETLTEHKEVCFTIQVALRGQAAERLHQNMVQLCDNSVLRLLRSRLRPERKHRHGVAKHLADLVYNQPRA